MVVLDSTKAFDTVWIDDFVKLTLYEMGILGKTWHISHRFYIDFICCVSYSSGIFFCMV